MSIDKILKPSEVAEILNVGYRSVLNLIKERKIKAFKVNKKYRILELDLEDYINGARLNKWDLG